MPSDKKKLKLDLTGKEHAYANFTKNDCAKEESVIGKFANKIVLEHVMKHPDRQFIIFNQLTDSHSIRADHVTYHRPPALQETPGTSSQSDK